MGLFGMPIFLGFLAYLIAQFRGFGIKVLSVQILVAALVILIVAMAFVQNVAQFQIIAIGTGIFTIFLGYLLVRSVSKEIELRMVVEKKEQELEASNKNQQTLLHFISHEVKGFWERGAMLWRGC